jgi:hypothetical protein
MGQSLNLKSGSKTLASIRIVNRRTDKSLIPILHENTVRFVGSENGEMYFEIMNQTEYDLTIDILNTNNDKINKIDLLKPFQKIIVERNELLGCSVVLEEYVTDKDQPLKFRDEKSRCLGEIKIGFDRAFGTSTIWDVDYCWVPVSNFQKVVVDGRTRTETDDGSTDDTTRALLRAGRSLEQVRFKEVFTNEKFYAYIKYDFGMFFKQQNLADLFEKRCTT